MKRFLMCMLHAAAVLFGLVAASVRPSFAFQTSTCNGWADPACEINTAWDCTTYGFCPVGPFGTGFVCCVDGSITQGFEYYR